MRRLAPGPADRRASPSSIDDLDSADIADTLVANDVDSRVGEEQSSSEDSHPNPSGLKDSSPSVSTDTDREVAVLKVQVNELAGMLRAFLAQQPLATPPSLASMDKLTLRPKTWEGTKKTSTWHCALWPKYVGRIQIESFDVSSYPKGKVRSTPNCC